MAKEKYPLSTPAHAAADQLLRVLETEKENYEESQRLLSAEFERLKKISPFWQGLKSDCHYYDMRMALAEKKLRKFEEEHKEDLFPLTGVPPESLKVELPGGDLFYSLEEYVVKPRKVDVLANLERYGFEEAIRRSAAVDWDALNDKEEWPDEALGIIGTERKKREIFTFELKKKEDGKTEVE